LFLFVFSPQYHSNSFSLTHEAFINHEPIEVEVTSIVPNKQLIGKQFKKGKRGSVVLFCFLRADFVVVVVVPFRDLRSHV
jgi:hypothetical protein